MTQKTRWADGFLIHDLANGTVDRHNPIFCLAAAKEFGSMNIPCSQIGPGPGSPVFMLDQHGTARSWRPGPSPGCSSAEPPAGAVAVSARSR